MLEDAVVHEMAYIKTLGNTTRHTQFAYGGSLKSSWSWSGALLVPNIGRLAGLWKPSSNWRLLAGLNMAAKLCTQHSEMRQQPVATLSYYNIKVPLLPKVDNIINSCLTHEYVHTTTCIHVHTRTHVRTHTRTHPHVHTHYSIAY